MVLVAKQKRSPAPQRKTRLKRHQRTDGHYTKPYWPYLPLVFMVLVGVIFSNLWGAVQNGVLGYATDITASSLASGTNNQRIAHGLGNLVLNSQLSQAAQVKADDMAARDYWSHNTPDGTPPWAFITNAGYSYQTAGENLAYGFDTSDAAITAWMNSPGHKANILGTTYTEVGFAMANAANYQGTGPQTIVVAMYASPKAVAAAPAPAPAATQPAPSPPPAPETAAPAPSQPLPAEPQPAAAPEEDNAVATAGNRAANSQPVTAQNVSRIQLLTDGQAPWSMFVLSAIAAVCLVIFLLRHGVFWHRMLVRGERFVMHHKLLDVALVGVAVVGFVLTRSEGLIR